jgi:hypothetical protein
MGHRFGGRGHDAGGDEKPEKLASDDLPGSSPMEGAEAEI